MKLIKENKLMTIITSVIVLMPIVIGLIYWDQLPQEMATHFGMNDEANGWSSKEFTVFGLPAILLVVHWLCTLCTSIDPKSANISSKIYCIVLWISPMVSIIAAVGIYGYELGWNVGSSNIVNAFMAMVFIVLGNYLPKCRQNYTIGIRIPWTLDNEENWNKTHRLAGKTMMTAGVLIMVNVFLDMYILMIAIILVAVLIPTIYSYMLYVKQNKNN